jgi:hypothetical protein
VNIESRALIGVNEDLGPYTSPTGFIDPVVKLIVTFGAGEQLEGTGFVLEGGTFDYVVITARHVLRPFGNQATQVEVVTTDGRCLGAAIAYPKGSADGTDCGVVLLLDSLHLSKDWAVGGPSAGVDTLLEGYAAGSNEKEVLELFGVKVHGATFKHVAISSALDGTSGGPVIQSDAIVGTHIREDVGLTLSIETLVNPCADAAYAKLKAVLGQ